MILISHRGNLNGKLPERENTKAYIGEALEAGFDVEIDAWKDAGCWYLGHDGPAEKITLEFLKNDKFWVHAKNIEALSDLVEVGAHCFFHNIDDATLTSRGFLWTFPGKKLMKNSIAVLPERGGAGAFSESCAGVCSDFIVTYSF